MADNDGAGGGLTAVDWVVAAAATAGLVVLLVWLVQGQPLPKRPAAAGQ